MDTELLRTFLEVRATRHCGRAAQNLFITQAAVSARIRQLEENLGAILFIRHRNNIQLSQEGERLVPHAAPVLKALARARQEVSLEDSASSQLHIGVRSGIWSASLQQKLLQLQDAEPDLNLSVQNQSPEELLHQVLQRTLDMAIVYEPPSQPDSFWPERLQPSTGPELPSSHSSPASMVELPQFGTHRDGVP